MLLNSLFPARYAYNNRINYEVFKDNIYSLETSIKAVKTIIKNENLKEYVIFLGDSVGYGTPCPPDKTMSAYINAIAKKEKSGLRVFNLAIPSSINARTPSFWLTHYLKELDRNTYNI